ncbi:hypothetical protein [Arsenicibacter rosenii]|uniref:hypothetical protein n=1 Tax=Arsenicibacter rosenii TaxID=1750698 RepID=UPI0015A66D26|nr:hypothetical protein [Arsenicibacter rosenii]
MLHAILSISSPCCGQFRNSTGTPKQVSSPDSVNEVAELVSNARAIRDSLTVFEDLKLRIKPIKSELERCREQNAALEVTGQKLRTAVNTMAEKYAQSDQRAADYRRQRNKARLEVWAWRVSAAAALYLWLR